MFRHSALSSLFFVLSTAWVMVGCTVDDSPPPGAPLNQAVINGDTCDEATQPDSVAIIVDAKMVLPFFGKIPMRSVLCTGTLIAPDTVLTAAHCLNPTLLTGGFGSVEDESYYISFQADLSAMVLDPQKIMGGLAADLPKDAVKAGSWIANPGFTVELLQKFPGGLGNLNDVALIFLEEPVTDLEPAVVITAEEAAQVKKGKEVTFSGWGQQTAEAQNPFQPPPKGSVGVKVCATSTINAVAEHEMQVGSDEKSARKCHGDSGGPSFMTVETEHARKVRVVGITSHAFDKTDCQKGGVDTRVDAWLDWIDEQMKDGCKKKARAWCEVEGIIPPGYYDPPPDLGPPDLGDPDGGAADAGEEEQAQSSCSLGGTPRGLAWSWVLAGLALAALRRRGAPPR